MTQPRFAALLSLFGAFFAYSCVLACFVQCFFLPVLAPKWHAGAGLLKDTDASAFHEEAVKMAASMAKQGWSAWSLKPNDDAGGGAVVSIAAVFYRFVAPKPWVLIPWNAAIHALSAVYVVLILLYFVGWRSALFGAIPFLAYPSALSWYAQIHRDGYGILGFLLLMSGVLRLCQTRTGKRNLGKTILEFLAGVIFIWLARDYLVNLLPYLLAPVFLLIAARHASGLKAAVLILLFLVPFALRNRGLEAHISVNEIAQNAPLPPGEKQLDNWHSSWWLPRVADRLLFGLSIHRNGMRMQGFYFPNESHIDNDVKFEDALGVLRYVPRALQIAFFAPFPNRWLDTQGRGAASRAMKRIAALEMLGIYFGLLGLVLGVPFLQGKIEFYALLWLSFSHLAFYALIVNNVGALYRYRYGYLMLLAGLGYGCLHELAKSGVFFKKRLTGVQHA